MLRVHSLYGSSHYGSHALYLSLSLCGLRYGHSVRFCCFLDRLCYIAACLALTSACCREQLSNILRSLALCLYIVCFRTVFGIILTVGLVVKRRVRVCVCVLE